MVKRNGKGQPLLAVGTLADISDRKQAELLLRIQYDFAELLSGNPDRDTLLRAIFDAALTLPELDGGRIYWRQADGSYGLAAHRGLSPEFIGKVEHLAIDSREAAIIRQGRMQWGDLVHMDGKGVNPGLVRSPPVVKEGLRALVVLPILADEQPIACLNLASRHSRHLSPRTVSALETLARQFGQSLQRLLAEQEAASQRKNLECLFEALNDLLFVLDEQGRILHYNQAVAERLGYGPSLLGQPVLNVHPPAARARAGQIVADMLAGNRASCPLPILKADGSQIMADTRVVRGVWSGKPALFGLSRDMTAEYQAQAALRDSEARFRTLFETANDALLILREGRCVDCNGKALEVFGCSRETIIGAAPTRFSPARQPDGEDSALKARAWLEAVEAGQPQRFEWRHARADGSEFDTEVSLNALELGGETLVQAIVRDITGRKQTENALLESERRFRAIADSAPVLIWMAGLDKGCFFFNQVWLDFTGRPLEQEQGDGWAEGVHPEDLPRCRETYVRSFDAREPFRMEYRLRRHDGEYRWLLDIGKPRSDPEGHFVGYIGSCIDITDRVEMERRLAETTRQAEAANRAKSDFLANMSHEIRTPMNAVLGLTGLVLETGLSPKQRDYLGKVESSARALTRLLNDILDYSKVEAGYLALERFPFRLSEVVQGVTDLFATRIEEKGLGWEAVLDPALPDYLVGDAFRLGQVLINLVGNAVKFTERGKVGLSLEMAGGTAESITVRATVRDTGIGMTPQQAEHLFAPFSQADSSISRTYGGTGLGLSISKRLVELMGGTLSVESREGLGSAFTFTVPLGKVGADADAGPSPAPGLPEAKPDGGARHDPAGGGAGLIQGAEILLAEDGPTSQLIAKTLMDKLGLRMTLAMDGAEAVEWVKRKAFDAVLMDVIMPVMDGIEAARLIRQLPAGAEVPIIAMTSAAMDHEKQACLDAGMNDHLAKPIDPGLFLETLLKWIKREPPVPGAFPAASADAPEAKPVDWARLDALAAQFEQELANNWLSAKKTAERIEDLLAGTPLAGAFLRVSGPTRKLKFKDALEAMESFDAVRNTAQQEAP